MIFEISDLVAGLKVEKLEVWLMAQVSEETL